MFRQCGMFYSLSSSLPRNVLLQLYNCLVYPSIIQNIIIWGGVEETHRRRVRVLMNKILRLILRVKYESHIPQMRTTDMYRQLGLMKFDDVYDYFLLKFIHFIQYDRFDLFINFFSGFLPSNVYSTRNSRMNLPPVRTNTEKRCVVFKCCELWRRVPDNLLFPQSNQSLKNNFKRWVMSNY